MDAPFTNSGEIRRIAELIRTCQSAGSPLPVPAILETLDLLALTAEAQELELRLFRGEIDVEAGRHAADDIMRRQHLASLNAAGGRMQS